VQADLFLDVQWSLSRRQRPAVSSIDDEIGLVNDVAANPFGSKARIEVELDLGRGEMLVCKNLDVFYELFIFRCSRHFFTSIDLIARYPGLPIWD
jgi:hypothetical protein